MTLKDWVEESIERYRTMPATAATVRSAQKFGRGIVRRTADPLVGKSIWERPGWDVCLVCDAARVDMTRQGVASYERFPDRDGVDGVWSNGSCSIDWINRTFNDPPDSVDLSRVGYVTANPFAHHDDPETRTARLKEAGLGHLRLVYETDWQELETGIETVPPERVTDHAIDAWRRRDELGIDKLVVHYMQPHEPFMAKPEWGNGDHKLLANLINSERAAGDSVFPRVRDGDVDLSEFKRVYEQNHHWVFGDIHERLLENMTARVAVTADHANGLGEWPGCWHHPPGRIHPAVRKVPWFVVGASDEETVAPDVGDSGGESTQEERLRALGYL